MKVHECLRDGHLYLATPIVRELHASLPENLDIKHFVIDMRPSTADHADDARCFVLMSDKHLIFVNLYLDPMKDREARSLRITTELRPLSAISEVKLNVLKGINGPYEYNVWDIEPTRYTVFFNPDTEWAPVTLPPRDERLSKESIPQYQAIGQLLYHRMLV